MGNAEKHHRELMIGENQYAAYPCPLTSEPEIPKAYAR